MDTGMSSFTGSRLAGLYLALGCTYLSGLFIPLMENDSAQHASMAMKMVLNNDYLSLFKGNAPYLDKPHLHFWLAALSDEDRGHQPCSLPGTQSPVPGDSGVLYARAGPAPVRE
ncbi:MAG: hypothetical protein LRY55_03705 [Leadbetterella sp.]|nr:hypothetical protein [Leadbetterella sp.]